MEMLQLYAPLCRISPMYSSCFLTNCRKCCVLSFTGPPCISRSDCPTPFFLTGMACFGFRRIMPFCLLEPECTQQVRMKNYKKIWSAILATLFSPTDKINMAE